LYDEQQSSMDELGGSSLLIPLRSFSRLPFLLPLLGVLILLNVDLDKLAKANIRKGQVGVDR